MNWKVASGLETGELGPAEASAIKVFGTEFQIDALRTLMEILGQPASSRAAVPGRCCSASSSMPTGLRRSAPSAAA